MSDRQDATSVHPGAVNTGTAPNDRIDRVTARGPEDDPPAVLAVASSGGARRAFLSSVARTVVAGSAAAVAACNSGSSGSSTTSPTPTPPVGVKLSGRVTDKTTGAAVSMAWLRFTDGPNGPKQGMINAEAQTWTDTNGTYQFTGLVSGTGNVEITKDGYQTTKESVAVTSVIVKDFQLAPLSAEQLSTPCVLAGHVTDIGATGAGWIMGARVTLTTGPDAFTWVGTDDYGAFKIQSKVRGRFTLRAGAAGYVTADQVVEIYQDYKEFSVSLRRATAPCASDPSCVCNQACPPCSCNAQGGSPGGHYWYPN